MNPDDTWAAIDAERTSLADLLDTVSPDEWSTPSLCNAWTVRQVVAHLSLSHFPATRTVVELARYRGNFNRMVHDVAVREAARTSTDEMIRRIRGMVGSRRHIIGTSRLDPLVDVLVHGQDIAIPLSRTRPMPVPAAMAAADRVWSMGFPYRARRRLGGVRLVATDAAWTRGDGAEIAGPIAALLLMLTGRDALTQELSGPGLQARRTDS
jgi:uncharacterized protein (TIGR03083 family)